MKNFISKLQRAANQFGIFDFALFKIYFFSLGILFGAYFASFWLQWISYLWIVAILSCIYVVVQLIRNYNR